MTQILFGKATCRKMTQNLIWATRYNIIALPVAAGVLYNWGIFLNPTAGAVLMSVSTIVVAINAKLLKMYLLYKIRNEDGRKCGTIAMNRFCSS
jgi:cation transport ATPase